MSIKAGDSCGDMIETVWATPPHIERSNTWTGTPKGALCLRDIDLGHGDMVWIAGTMWILDDNGVLMRGGYFTDDEYRIPVHGPLADMIVDRLRRNPNR